MITGNIANKSQFSIKKIQLSKKPTSVREYFLYLHIDVCKKKVQFRKKNSTEFY